LFWSLPHLGKYDPSTAILISVIVAAAMIFVLLKLGAIRFLVSSFSKVVRRFVRAGFELWKRTLVWAIWPYFAFTIAVVLALDWLVVDWWPWFGLISGTILLYMGVITCLAYMFVDVERYEVGRGYKALYNPLKGQELATSLARYGHQVGVPLLLAASVAAVCGFALLNLGLYRTVGNDWYDEGLRGRTAEISQPGQEAPDDQLTFVDFLAYPVINLLRIVDLMDISNSYRVLEAKHVHPHRWPAAVLLAGFKTLFTLVLLQQVFASLRWGKLLSETIAEIWSPHEPIQQRARGSLAQHGTAAIRPLLVSVRSIDFLTREQREQLPLILARIGPGAIPILARYLGDSSENVRAITAAALGHLHARDRVPALVGLKNDPSDWVRQSLVEALGQIGSPRGNGSVRRLQFCKPVRMSVRFLDALFHHRPKPQIDVGALMVSTLRDALVDPVVTVRTAAAQAVGLLGTAASPTVPQLLALLQDPEEVVRCRAAESLGSIGGADKRVIDALIGLLPDVSANVRESSAKALGEMKSDAADALSALLPLLKDREDTVREAAAVALRTIGKLNGDHTPQLVEGLASPDTEVRADTAEALGEIGSSAAEATPALVRALADPNDRVRAQAAQALGKIGESAADAVPNLVRALRDRDSWVSALAAEALGEMGESADGAVPALIQSLHHLNPQVRANAAETLARMGTAALVAISALNNAARDEDGEVRANAVRALGEIGGNSPPAERAVRGAVGDEDPQVRAAAFEAMGKLGLSDAKATTVLLQALDDTHESVQVEAAKALVKLGDASESVINALVRLLDDKSAVVQVNAASALAGFGPAAAAAGPALLRVAQNGEATLRAYAVRALILIRSPETMPALLSGLADATIEIRKMASAGFIVAPSIPEDAIPLLVDSLRDPEALVRANAANALARLDELPSSALEPLIECSADGHDGLRMNAAMALENAPPVAVAEVFAHLIDDPNARVRLIAAGFLLQQDLNHERAISVASEALLDPLPRLRSSALELVVSLGEKGGAFLKPLEGRAKEEGDPEVRKRIAELLEKLKAVKQKEMEVTAVVAPRSDQ
jgi:HEAT repeat protein